MVKRTNKTQGTRVSKRQQTNFIYFEKTHDKHLFTSIPKVFSYLDARTLISCKRSCKYLFHILKEHPELGQLRQQYFCIKRCLNESWFYEQGKTSLSMDEMEQVIGKRVIVLGYDSDHVAWDFVVNFQMKYSPLVKFYNTDVEDRVRSFGKALQKGFKAAEKELKQGIEDYYSKDNAVRDEQPDVEEVELVDEDGDEEPDAMEGEIEFKAQEMTSSENNNTPKLGDGTLLNHLKTVIDPTEEEYSLDIFPFTVVIADGLDI